MYSKKNIAFLVAALAVFLIIPTNKDVANAYVCVAKNNTAACRDLNVTSREEAKSLCNQHTEVMVTGVCGNVIVNQGRFGCVDISGGINNGFCRNIEINTNFEAAQTSCGTTYIPIYRPCPENPEPVVTQQYYGCIRPVDLDCINIVAADKDEAAKQCLETYTNKARPQIQPCLPAKSYPCFINRTGGCHKITANTLESAKKQCRDACELDSKDECELEADFHKKCPDESDPLAGTSARDLKNLAAETLNPAHISSPFMLISRAINFLVGIVGSITLLLYVVAGFMWMTAHGASEQVDRAKKIMVWTTLGVMVMLFSYILTNALFDFIPKLSL
jgi:hypothetical protein